MGRHRLASRPKAGCHPAEPRYALGLCKRCYDRLAQQKYRIRRRLVAV